MRSIALYHRHRFPAEIISHCVWLYFRFPLSFRDVEEMLAMRGVVLSYETIRAWCLKFGQIPANSNHPPQNGHQLYLLRREANKSRRARRKAAFLRRSSVDFDFFEDLSFNCCLQ